MIIVAGKNNIAVKAIDYLRKNYHNDIAIIPNKDDRGTHSWQQSVIKFAKDFNLNLISLEQAYTEATIFISLESDRIVDPEKFKKANLYNLHFSNLPKYKGMYTSIWPILNNEKIAGVTLHQIDSGIDTGEIYQQVIFDVRPVDRARDLYRNYLIKSYELYIKSIDGILTGTLKKSPQSPTDSSYFSKSTIDFTNIKINLQATAHQILRQIYGFTFREYQLPIIFNKKIVEAEILGDRSKQKPGSIVSIFPESFVISTIDYDMRLYIDMIDSIFKFANCTPMQAKTLLKNLAGINDRNHKGWSPLIVAAYHGNHDVVNFLLDEGALINDENYNGTSVLMYAKEFALKTGDMTSFQELILRGADLEKKDYFGKSLIDYLTISEAKLLGL